MSTAITKTDLITRGWTEGLIKKHLGEPDELKTNPHYKSGPPMRLYSMSRVEPFEKEAWFLETKSIRAIRSAAARKAAERKREELILLGGKVGNQNSSYAIGKINREGVRAL